MNRYVRRDPGRTPGSAPRAWPRAREIDDYLRRLRRRAPTATTRRRSRPTSSTGCSRSTPATGRSTTPRSSTSSSRCSSAAPRRCRRSSPAAPTSCGAIPSSAPRSWPIPSSAAPAFEEMLRYELPLQFVGRTLLVDAEVAGEAMRAGQRVVLMLISREPRRARVRRSRALRRPPPDGTPPRARPRRARLHRRARRAARRGGDGAGAARRASPTTRSITSALEREASEFHVGWAAMPIATGLGSAGSGGPGQRPPRRRRPG